jgi:hypothetical protein
MDIIQLFKNENFVYVTLSLISGHFWKLIILVLIFYVNQRLQQHMKDKKEVKLKELEQKKGCNLAESKTQELINLLKDGKKENREINQKLEEINESNKIEKTIYVKYIEEAAEEIKKQGRDINSMKGINKNIEIHLKTVDTIFTQLIKRVGNNGK